MPATSISSLGSWGLYILASGALVVVLSPTLTAIGTSSHVTEAANTIDGLATLVNTLQPGDSVTITLGSVNSGDRIQLDGHVIAYQAQGFEMNRTTVWPVRQTTMLPGTEYQFDLLNSTVLVTPIG